MRYDILFHITTQEAFKEFKTGNNYEPESLEAEGFIRCSGGDKIKEIADRLFAHEQKILLLVLDVATLRSEVKYEMDKETGQKIPRIYGPLNTEAIIDKINVQAEKDNTFDISFHSYS